MPNNPIPGCDPNEAYEVVPLVEPIRESRDPHGWHACICNGIVVRIAADPEPLHRYATDPEYRASLITRKAWEKNVPEPKVSEKAKETLVIKIRSITTSAFGFSDISFSLCSSLSWRA